MILCLWAWSIGGSVFWTSDTSSKQKRRRTTVPKPWRDDQGMMCKIVQSCTVRVCLNPRHISTSKCNSLSLCLEKERKTPVRQEQATCNDSIVERRRFTCIFLSEVLLFQS